MGCVIIRAIVVQMLALYLWGSGDVEAVALSQPSSALLHNNNNNGASDSELVNFQSKKDRRHKTYVDYNDDVVRDF